MFKGRAISLTKNIHFYTYNTTTLRFKSYKAKFIKDSHMGSFMNPVWKYFQEWIELVYFSGVQVGAKSKRLHTNTEATVLGRKIYRNLNLANQIT